MSANSAVTVFRSPSTFSAAGVSPTRIGESFGFFADGAGGFPSAAAHSPQNFAVGAFSYPHCAQRFLKGAAHSLQNFCSAGFSAPHAEHFMSRTQLVEQRLGVLQVGGVEALGEPVVDIGEHRVSFGALALLRE